MKKFLTLLLFLSLSAFNVQAAQPSAEQIAQIESYLNNLKTLEAEFVQTASNGSTAEGKIYIAKPNKIRMEYGAPVDVDIIGNGEFIVYNDKELDQVTHIDYDDIPATLILANDIKIDGHNLKVIDFYEDRGTIMIVVEYPQKKDINPITLIFSKEPFELKQWKVTDPQSVEVTVSLYAAQKDVDLDSKLFQFRKDKKNPLNYKKR